MPLDLDFYITVAGTDVTKDVASWELHDTEDGISTIKVSIVSPDHKYDGKFSSQDEIALSWGASSQMLGPVEFKVRYVNESWSPHGSTINLRALDWTERLVGLNVRGMFPPDVKPTKAIKQMGDTVKMKIEVKAKDAKYPKNHKQSAPNIRMWDKFDELQWKLFPDANDGNEPYQEQRSADKDSGNQGNPKIKKGVTPAGGHTKATEVNPAGAKPGLQAAGKKAAEQARAENMAKHAGSLSIRAKLELVDYPWMKAKECVTVLNAGPRGSGIWYVQTVDHRWTTKGGYRASCSLLRIDTGKDAKNTPQAQSGDAPTSADTRAETNQWADATAAAGLPTGTSQKPMGMKGAPIVRYAEIFKKDHVYIGPRKLNSASQASFTVGDGKSIIGFSWTLNVQLPKDSGENVYHEDLAPNAFNKAKEAEAWKGATQIHGEPTT